LHKYPLDLKKTTQTSLRTSQVTKVQDSFDMYQIGLVGLTMGTSPYFSLSISLAKIYCKIHLYSKHQFQQKKHLKISSGDLL
jgi:hypothetical protein